MKRNPAGFILAALLFISACGTVVLSLKFFFGVKELQLIQGQVFRISATLNAAQSLANESVDYSRRNPAIDPILYQFEIKSKGAGPGQPQTATPR
jgi:hypothetical protein